MLSLAVFLENEHLSSGFFKIECFYFIFKVPNGPLVPSGTSPQVPLSSTGSSALSAHDIVIESRVLSKAKALEICFALQWMHTLDRFCLLVAPRERSSL